MLRRFPSAQRPKQSPDHGPQGTRPVSGWGAEVSSGECRRRRDGMVRLLAEGETERCAEIEADSVFPHGRYDGSQRAGQRMERGGSMAAAEPAADIFPVVGWWFT